MSSLVNLALLLALIMLVTFERSAAYNIPILRREDMTATPTQLVSKLLVQSPTLDNIYMDYLVTSKPLHLRKYNSKTKKTKKDSKIYFIPIPPLPYRYIPGIGYDYQPMKIKPIVAESAHSSSPKPSATDKHQHYPPTTAIPATLASSPSSTPAQSATSASAAQSKVFRVQHHKDYYFNGRPFRLQVAHADRKSALTPLNLKSRFYYNKNIIY